MQTPPFSDDPDFVPPPPLDAPEEEADTGSNYFSAAGRPWAQLLLRNQEGAPKPVLYNALIVLENDPALKDEDGESLLRYDKFRGRARAWGPLPWDRNSQYPRDWTDQDDRECNAWLQDAGIFLGQLVTGAAVQTIVERNGYHPVVDYLQRIVWDGEARLDLWLADYLGVEDTLYSRAVGARFLIAGCARVNDPGCKVDTALILEGPQGRKKSMALDVIGGPYYTSDLTVIGSKDSQEQLMGKWIVELDELDAVSRAADVAAVKAFISRRVDDFRLPYAHRSRAQPRQCVFAGTTNRDNWNRDETGGRRYWPVRVGEIDIDRLREDRDQLWAEANSRWSEGYPWWLDEPELVELARIEQDARFEIDPWEDAVVAAVKDMAVSKSRGLSSTDILAMLGIPTERRGRSESGRLGSILRHLNWRREFIDIDGSGRRVWRFFPK